MTAPTNLSTYAARIEKAAEILKSSYSEVQEALDEIGVVDSDEGLKLLDAQTTSTEDLLEILTECCKTAKKLQVKAAASVLKGVDPFSAAPKEEPQGKIEVQPLVATGSASVETLVKVLNATKPIGAMKDRELLELWIVERDYEQEMELHRRAKNDRFVLLLDGKFEPGKEQLDVENTLKLLRDARKRKNPSIYPIGETVAPVYYITQLNMKDRVIELCPFCGKALYNGYCQDCQLNFTGIADDERAYMHLIAESDNFEVSSFADRRAVYASAKSGVADLKKTWPSLIVKFDELKASNDLPRLRIVEDRPSREVQDPFHVAGNRKF